MKLNRIVNSAYVDAPYVVHTLGYTTKTFGGKPRSVSNNPPWVEEFDKPNGVFFTTQPTMTHSKLVKTLFRPSHEILATLSTEKMDILHAAVGISGEAGEILDSIKKMVFNRKSLMKDDLIKELGDLEFYIEALRQAMEITRDETLDGNIEKLMKRYPNGYSDAASAARIDVV